MIALPEQYVALLAADRLAEAAAHNRAARVQAVRRHERRAAAATRRAQLVRLAIR